MKLYELRGERRESRHGKCLERREECDQIHCMEFSKNQ